MIILKDQMNRTIRLENYPKRIVSLVPSQSELLFDLGLENEVVGITKFCIHPKKWHSNKTRVGGTKTINFETIKSLNPDLIIANKEENTQEEIEALTLLYNVYISDINNVEQACDMILAIGELTNTSDKAISISELIKEDFLNIPSLNGTVLYFIWANPYMVAGNNTFIGYLLNKLGLINGVEDVDGRYIEIEEEEIRAIEPKYIFLSSEPYPFKEKHVTELKKIIPEGEVHLVDGEMFSWYGSRMLKMTNYFIQLFNTIR